MDSINQQLNLVKAGQDLDKNLDKNEKSKYNESYTSKTCTNCGYQNSKNNSEHIKCESCKIHLDQDLVGSRNILLKYLS